MNDFIRKYRWTLILVAVGVAVALTYYNRQETEMVVAVEEAPMVEVVEVVEQEETPAVEPVAEVFEPEPTPEPAQEPAAPAVEEATTESTEETTMVKDVAEAITAPEAARTEGVIKPNFDVVRVDATGSAVIAGSAEPFSTVVIRSNGEEIGEAIADSSGEFVEIIQVPENDQGQTLELETEISGQLVFSDESIIILPILRSQAAETVTEEYAPPIIRATADEVVIIQGGAQLSLGRVSLDSISYDENDEVVLVGRGNPGRTIIIYVDDRPLMDVVASESGSWKQVLHGLDAGLYVLRVDEIDDNGNVTSRVESPFQREYPEDVREAKAQNNTTYTVQPGNSLWIIATGRYGNGMQYHQIFAANHHQIRDPDLIYPGQVFALPDT
ncbi:MAG: Ig-like domain-containing protein [Paracoccaceae bacterium]